MLKWNQEQINLQKLNEALLNTVFCWIYCNVLDFKKFEGLEKKHVNKFQLQIQNKKVKYTNQHEVQVDLEL